jgi:hypothetical protein
MNDRAAEIVREAPTLRTPQDAGTRNERTTRGPGKPKGHPKTGGRKKGTPNVASQTTRAEIQARVVTVANSALEKMARIAAGEAIFSGPHGSVGKASRRVPSIEMQMRAASTIIDKVLPALKASEITGADGAPLIPSAAEPNKRDLARAIMGVFRDAHIAGEGALAVASPGQTLVRVTDPDLAAKVLPTESVTPSRIHVSIDGVKPSGWLVEQRFDGPRGQERWAIVDPAGVTRDHRPTEDEARAACRATIETDAAYSPREARESATRPRVLRERQ